MNERDLKFVQNQIGYSFKNISLLKQAFIKLCSENIDSTVHNDMLEFYGDKILGFILAKKFCSDTSRLSLKGNFISGMTAGMLSQEYVKFSKNEYLAERIEKLGFRDIYKKNQHNRYKKINTKSEGDLFEAILGAVAVDCEWNCDTLDKVIERMIIEDLSENFCSQDVITFAEENNLGHVDFKENVLGKNVNYTVCFPELSKEFSSVSKKAREAESQACSKAIKFFEMAISNERPEAKKPMEQLDQLVTFNYIPTPEYFNSVQDRDGNECWITTCSIEGFKEIATGSDSDFDKSQNIAAEKMLDFIFDVTPKITEESVEENQSEKEEESSSEEDGIVGDELNYVSQLYIKVDKKELSLPEFTFECIDGIYTCTALIDGETYIAKNEHKQTAKKDVCKQILDELNDSYSQYFV